jgi:hypothetical protein
MNGRIRQLCQQKANYWMNHYDRKSLADMSLLYNDVEKFAELIVRECLNTMENCDGDLDFAIWKTKEHFGVDND